MAVLILDYDLAQKLGCDRLEIAAATVGELVELGIARHGEPFAAAVRTAAIVLNGRSVNLLRGKKTRLQPDDQIWLIHPSSGG